MRKKAAIFLIGIGILFSFTQLSATQWVKTDRTDERWITALAVKGTNLFAGTWTHGVYRLRLSDISIKK